MSMENNQSIRVWSGERTLLPNDKAPYGYQLHCLVGEGYLRIMSSARRQFVKRGDQLTIIGDDIATLTGKKTMLVELRKLKNHKR